MPPIEARPKGSRSPRSAEERAITVGVSDARLGFIKALVIAVNRETGEASFDPLTGRGSNFCDSVGFGLLEWSDWGKRTGSMDLPFDLISTDFDGTIFEEFETPSIAHEFERRIAWLQERGVKWVINTGRSYDSLMLSLEQADLSVTPNYLVLVEREIHIWKNGRFAGHDVWNEQCEDKHASLFELIRMDVRELSEWVRATFPGTHVYSDAHSPMCVTARCNEESDAIQIRMQEYCETHPELVWVRNDVHSRFSHIEFSKGTALREIAERLDIPAERIFAAGDELNDLPMLRADVAGFLAAPANAVPEVREQVESEGGYVATRSFAAGVDEAIGRLLE